MQSIADLLDSLPKRTVKLPDESSDKPLTVAKDLAFTVSGIMRLDVLQAVLDSLDANIKSGGSFAAWKRLIEAEEIPLDVPPHRAELVFRMHAQTAYAHGKCNNFEVNKLARPYLMYSAINDSRTRPAHKKMNGIIRPVGDEFWAKNFVPAGWNCRCTIIALTEKQAKARGGVTENPIDGYDEGFDHSPCSNRVAGEEKALERKMGLYNGVFSGIAKALLSGLAAIRGLLGGK